MKVGISKSINGCLHSLSLIWGPWRVGYSMSSWLSFPLYLVVVTAMHRAIKLKMACKPMH